MDEPSKTSVPDTPSLTTKDPWLLEVAKGQTKACSQYNILVINVYRSDQLLVQMISRKESVI